jgi:hypothetical protein
MSAIWGKADMTRTLDTDAKSAIATSATLNLAVQCPVYRTSVKKGRDPNKDNFAGNFLFSLRILT